MFSQILLLFMINVLSAIGYSLLAPLYPVVAKSKGVEEYLIGLIFSFFAFSNIIAIPLTPKLISKFGRRKLFYIAMIIEAACTILFGLVDKIESRFFFISISLLSRFCQGIGSAISATLVYSIAATVCDEENLKITMGYMELAYSIGLTIGPLVASLLYYIQGYSFPFYVCGALTLLCIPFISYLDIVEENYEEPDFLNILFNLDILITVFAIITDMITTTFIYPVFTQHLFSKFGLSTEASSIFFVISMFSYFITLQFLNRISNRIGVKLTICVGLILNFITVPLLAPVSFLPQNLITIIIGLIILGMTGACITVPGIVDFMDTMKNKMKIEEIAANDVSSAIYNLSINTGEALGPIIGGSFTNFYSFNRACYFTSSLCLFYSIVFGFYNYNNIKDQYYPKEEEALLGKEDEYKDLKLLFHRKESIEPFSYVTKYRAYSFSKNKSSRKSSLFSIMK